MVVVVVVVVVADCDFRLRRGRTVAVTVYKMLASLAAAASIRNGFMSGWLIGWLVGWLIKSVRYKNGERVKRNLIKNRTNFHLRRTLPS